MQESHFFAHLARMKLIQRWPLMRSISSENISEHSLQVAFVAHALAVIKNKKFGGTLNPERIALLAMYHDTSEVLTLAICQRPSSISIPRSLKSTKKSKRRPSGVYWICSQKNCATIFARFLSPIRPIPMKAPSLSKPMRFARI